VTLYRLFLSLAFPALAALAVLRVLRGREDRAALAARLGLAPASPDRRPTIWLHAASNGELASIRPFLDRLRADRPDLRLLVTTNSVTGRDLALSWGLAAQCAPFDLRSAALRLIRGWDIRAHWIVESELWPNRLAACAGAGVPVAVLGARLSARTARGWARMPGLARPMLDAIGYVSAQDEDSAARLRGLGLDPSRLGPELDLKALYEPPATPRPGPDLAAAYPRATTWLAASTHEGEEEAVIAAHLEARKARPGLRLILAPRHPSRAEAVAALLARAGLDFDRRSRAEARGAEVLLADTLGEMALWYRLAGTVLVGGSLVAKGGHTPYEPAAFGCALLHGPHLDNFGPAYGRLAEAGAAREVSDADSLAEALAELADPTARAALAARAQAALARPDASEAVLAALLQRLPAPEDSC